MNVCAGQRPPPGAVDRAWTRLTELPRSHSAPEIGHQVAVTVSIAVINWVWANSPTSGNERLVLLALADACSRDDGTGCWPSAPMLLAIQLAQELHVEIRRAARASHLDDADVHAVGLDLAIAAS